MAKSPKAFDVWFVAAEQVYKGVPYNVVADWAQQGRLAGTDMVRPTGTKDAWVKVSAHDLLADYLPLPAVARTVPEPAEKLIAAEVVGDAEPPTTNAPVELPEPEPGPPASRFEEDDEVDMIPLIDISMVLLVFFIMIQAAGALAPVDVPEMQYAGELKADPEAITITIDFLNDKDVYYSVRVGQAPPLPNHDKLLTPEAALKALNEVLAGTTRPPEVRIANHRDLPRKRVYELRMELEPLRKKGIIYSTVATVVEAKKQ
jgi:biopolymer transport protein ExbD